MKKIIIIIALMIIGTGFQAIAQYGFGTNAPNQKAIIDAKQVTDKGVFIPNVALTGATDATTIAVTGTETSLMVYNTATAGTSPNQIYPGFHYWNGTRWVRVGMNWFYMPSIKLDLTNGTGKTINLYTEYTNQFTGAGGWTIKSSNGTTTLPYIPAVTEIDFYVIYNDDCFSNVSINPTTGVMTYDVNSALVDSGSFMNVIFVIK